MSKKLDKFTALDHDLLENQALFDIRKEENKKADF